MAFNDIMSGTGLGSELVKTAYDKYVLFALRSFPMFRQLADKKVVDQSMPGDSIVFNLYQDMSTNTTPLTETVDPTPIQLPATTQVTVTLNEYGANTATTRKLRLFTLSDVDPAIANIVAYNMVNSLDEVVRDVIRDGTHTTMENGGNMVLDTGTTGAVTATDVLQSRDIRASVTRLRSRNVMPTNGSSYVCILHPDASYDLRSEAGSSATWRAPHENVSPGPIWAGHIGEYEGAVFIESPRTYSANDGATSATVHRSIMVGQQCLAEAVASEPSTVIGPITDTLNRFRPIGWYGVLGWSIYRDEAIQRIETSSSLAA